MSEKIFSFCLFGNEDKYCKGLLKNLECIEKRFPSFKVFVYIGDGVPQNIIEKILNHRLVQIFYTGQIGYANKFYRFFAIDDPSVSIAIVRDADSRIYERDIACIDEFIYSEKLFHIIRDHPNHTWKIMAGMWGVKKGIIDNMRLLYEKWKSRKSIDFWDDQIFLSDIVHPIVKDNALVHEAFPTSFESESCKKPFQVPVKDRHFIGQVYEFKESIEYAKF